MKFRGNYENLIDNKGRMSVPSKFRKALKSTVFVSAEFENSLVLRSADEFKSWESRLNDLDPLDKASRTLQRLILGNSDELKIDSKGRINLPKTLMNSVGIKEKVYVVGVGNRIEIHSAQSWKQMNNKTSLEEAAEEISKK